MAFCAHRTTNSATSALGQKRTLSLPATRCRWLAIYRSRASAAASAKARGAVRLSQGSDQPGPKFRLLQNRKLDQPQRKRPPTEAASMLRRRERLVQRVIDRSECRIELRAKTLNRGDDCN